MRFLRRIPVTLTLGAILVVVSALSGGLRRSVAPGVREHFGTGLDPFLELRSFHSVLTSVFLASGPAQLIVTLVALLVLVGVSERLMGWWRTLLAFVASAVVGNAIGIALQAVGVLARDVWALDVRDLTTTDPFTPIAGTIMAASAFAGGLWRRRIRVVGFAVLIMFALYSGQPGDLFRLIAAVVGLLLGMLFTRRRITFIWKRSSLAEFRGLLAAVLVITAFGPLITIFSAARFGPLHSLGLLFRDVLPRMATVSQQCRLDNGTKSCLRDLALARLDGVGPVLLDLMPLVVLVIAALGILQAKRFAAYLAIAVNLLLAGLAAFYYGVIPFSGVPYAAVNLHSPLERSLALWISVLVPLVVAILIAVGIRSLTVRVVRRHLLQYLFALATTFLVLSVLYLGVGWLTRAQFRPAISFDELLTDLPERFIPAGFLGVERIEFVPIGEISRLVYQWIGPAFWLVVAIGAVVVLGAIERGESAEDRARGRLLVQRWGGGSLSHMTTWRHNRWWFSPDGESAVAFRLVNGVAIAVSDPIGPAGSAPGTIALFATYCDDQGWIPVFYAIHDDHLATFRQMGWSSMNVGEETVLHTEGWSMTGSKWQDVRSALNRAQRLGVRAEWAQYDHLSLLTSTQLNEISELWVAERNLPELGFTLGGLAELRDPSVWLMLAITPQGRVEGVTSWLPQYRDSELVGWTLDFMRRRPDSMKGVMEFLIASTVIQAQHLGMEMLSLSAAPLAVHSSGERVGVERLLNFIGSTLEPVYGFRSLLQFKQKFQPELRPLLLAYPESFLLPNIATAIARAYLPSMSMKQTLHFMRNLI